VRWTGLLQVTTKLRNQRLTKKKITVRPRSERSRDQRCRSAGGVSGGGDKTVKVWDISSLDTSKCTTARPRDTRSPAASEGRYRGSDLAVTAGELNAGAGVGDYWTRFGPAFLFPGGIFCPSNGVKPC